MRAPAEKNGVFPLIILYRPRERVIVLLQLYRNLWRLLVIPFVRERVTTAGQKSHIYAYIIPRYRHREWYV